MTARRGPRWAVSFADLCLLLLGFFVLLQAHPDRARFAAGIRHALGTVDPPALRARAADWFEPGEAVLRPQARARLCSFAHGAAHISITTHGTEPRTPRFDGWELAAARAAAIAREIAASGVPEAAIGLSVDPSIGGGQTVAIDRR